jgi:hypothetical protein
MTNGRTPKRGSDRGAGEARGRTDACRTASKKVRPRSKTMIPQRTRTGETGASTPVSPYALGGAAGGVEGAFPLGALPTLFSRHRPRAFYLDKDERG